MAEPNTSDSSQDTDRDFEPTADMLVNEFDDERTLDKEEQMERTEDVQTELNELHKEGVIPLDELLDIYGYTCNTGEYRESGRNSVDGDTTPGDLDDDSAQNQDTEVTQPTSRLLRPKAAFGVYNHQSESETEEDEDYLPAEEQHPKKTIQVGHNYQATVPEGLSKYGDAPAYENEDKLVWDPLDQDDSQVEDYLRKAAEVVSSGLQGIDVIPTGSHIKDDEQALYLLLQCNHDFEEALQRCRTQEVLPPLDVASAWSEDECRNFENGIRTYGKDFHQIQLNKVQTRSVGELVQFYYLWKKTDRHDQFANKSRLEKKKYSLHPGTPDYLDIFLEDTDPPCSPTSYHTFLSPDYKRTRSPDTDPAVHSYNGIKPTSSASSTSSNSSALIHRSRSPDQSKFRLSDKSTVLSAADNSERTVVLELVGSTAR